MSTNKKCPFMSKFITDFNAIPLGYEQVLNYYTTLNNNPSKTDYCVDKNIELYNLLNKEHDKISNNYMLYHDCIEEKCQLWDNINKRCGAKVSDTVRSEPDNEIPTLITMLETVLGKLSEKGEAATGESILVHVNHEHDSHKHAFRHLCQEIPTHCGKSVGGASTSVSPSTTLMMEFQGNQDIDDNGLIYGRDFKISESLEKPSILRSIENSPYWMEPNLSISWSSYLAWFENPIDVSNPLS